MKLHELRQELETDAAKRADQQEKTIKELHARIKDLENMARTAQNKCFSFTFGAICVFCIDKEKCAAWKSAKGRCK